MATATFLATVSHKHRIQVDFPVAHRYQVPMDNTPIKQDGEYVIDGEAITMTKAERIAWLIDQYESGVKADWPEWIEQDTTRDGSVVSEIQRLDHTAGEGWDVYDLVVSWTITATARLTIDVETDLYPEDAANVFQAAAEQAASEWIAARPLIPL